jgi:hypothetical protein
MLRYALMPLICSLAIAAAPALHVPVLANSQGLSAENLKISLDGKPGSILAIRGPEAGLVLIVVLDLTQDVDLAGIAREALLAGIDKLPANARIAVMRAQDGLHVVLDPTGDRAELAAAIRGAPVAGKPGLLDTIETSAQVADSILSKTAVRVAVLYVTDSNIYNYRDDYTNPVINSSDSHDMSRRFPEGLVREKISKLESKLARYQAPLFIVYLVYRDDRLNEAYQAGLAQLAAGAGGSSAFCRSRGEIPGAIAGALGAIASHYSVVVALPDHRRRTVTVQLHQDGKQLAGRSRFVVEESRGPQ